MNKKVLVVAGSDSDGAAGIQGDIKTLAAFRTYSATVVTSVTAANTQGIDAIHNIPMHIVGAQLEAVAGDIEFDAVKVGMLGTCDNIRIVSTLLESFELPRIVVDPVFESSTGASLLEEGGVEVLAEELLPLAEVVTPNLDEASRLSDMEVDDVPSMKEAAEKIHKFGPENVVVTGGHLDNRPMDVLYDGKKFSIFDSDTVPSDSTHGAGDAFSAMIAAKFAEGTRLPDSIDAAKKYIAKALNHPFDIGVGEGPIQHGVPL